MKIHDILGTANSRDKIVFNRNCFIITLKIREECNKIHYDLLKIYFPNKGNARSRYKFVKLQVSILIKKKNYISTTFK